MGEEPKRPGRWVARHEIWFNGERVARKAGDTVPEEIVEEAGFDTMPIPGPWVDWVEDTPETGT